MESLIVRHAVRHALWGRVYVAVLTRREDVIRRRSVPLFVRLLPQLKDGAKGIIVQGNLPLTGTGLGPADRDDPFEQIHIQPAQVFQFGGAHRSVERQNNRTAQPQALRIAARGPQQD